jgi:hypothetical protein
MLTERRQLVLFGRLPAAVLVLLGSSAMAQGLNSSRYPISEADITKALTVVGVSVDTSHVLLPIHMSAAGGAPRLEIVTAQPVGENQVRLELRCTKNCECLPFLATLDIRDASLISAAIRSRTSSETIASHKTAPQGGSQGVGQLQGTSMSAVPADEPKLRVGSHAVLEITDGLMDIHLQVVAIDAGGVGQQVRVCTLDRKKVFHATVTGEETVTGVME